MPRPLPLALASLLLLGPGRAPALALPPLAVVLDALDAAEPLDSDNLTLMATPEASAAVKEGDKALRAGQPVPAAGHYARARGLVAAGGDAMLDVLSRLDSNLVALYLQMRRHEVVVDMARTLQQARQGARPAARVEAGRLLARALFMAGKPDEALAAAQEALALCQAQEGWGPDHAETLRTRWLLGLGKLLAQRDPDAVNEVLNVVDALRAKLGETSVEYVRLVPGAAVADLVVRRIAPAKEALAVAIRGMEAALGDTNPLLEAALWLRADAAEADLTYREATTDRTRVHALMAAAFGAEHPRALAAQLAVARQALTRGLLREARDGAADVAKAPGPLQAEAGILQAAAQLELDETAAAAAAATEARSRAGEPVLRAEAETLLALAQARRGPPFAKARARAKEAVDDLAKALGARTIEVARLELRLADLEHAAGNHGPALRLIKDVAKLFPETASLQDRIAFLGARARARWREEKGEGAEQDLAELFRLAEPLHHEAPLALARERVLWAEVALATGDKELARQRFAEAKAAVARLPEGALAATEFLGFQTRVALSNEAWDAAVTVAEQWLAAIHASGGENDPRLAEANLLLSDAHKGGGDLEQALEAARRVQGMGRRTPDGLPGARKGAAVRVAALTGALAEAAPTAPVEAASREAAPAEVEATPDGAEAPEAPPPTTPTSPEN